MKKLYTMLMSLFMVASAFSQTIGDTTRTPDLYVPFCEKNWINYGFNDTCFGAGGRKMTYFPERLDSSSRWDYPELYDRKHGDSVFFVRYICPIANGAVQPSGDYTRNDFVVCRPCDGIENGRFGYDFPGMISITLFKEGVQVGRTLKQEFWVSPSAETKSFDPNRVHYYDGDTMYIWPQTADIYYNQVAVDFKNGKAQDGYYIIVIHVNPEEVIRESNYDNNFTIVPFKVVNNTAFVDYLALEKNKPIPPSSLSSAVTWGKSKYVTLTWTSASKYDEFIILKDGIVVADEHYSHTYVDTVSGSWKSSTYTVKTILEGVGESDGLSITAKRSVGNRASTEEVKKVGFLFTPNPVKDKLSFTDRVVFTVSDINGRVLLTGDAREVEVSLRPGLYVLTIGETSYLIVKE